MPPALLLELAENRESGVNPERYRHCMRGGTPQDESQPLGGILRRQRGGLRCASQETCLNIFSVRSAFDDGMDSIFVMEKRPWQLMLSWLFHVLAVC